MTALISDISFLQDGTLSDFQKRAPPFKPTKIIARAPGVVARWCCWRRWCFRRCCCTKPSLPTSGAPKPGPNVGRDGSRARVQKFDAGRWWKGDEVTSEKFQQPEPDGRRFKARRLQVENFLLKRKILLNIVQHLCRHTHTHTHTHTKEKNGRPVRQNKHRSNVAPRGRGGWCCGWRGRLARVSATTTSQASVVLARRRTPSCAAKFAWRRLF